MKRRGKGNNKRPNPAPHRGCRFNARRRPAKPPVLVVPHDQSGLLQVFCKRSFPQKMMIKTNIFKFEFR